jgi:hypothetical protein
LLVLSLDGQNRSSIPRDLLLDKDEVTLGDVRIFTLGWYHLGLKVFKSLFLLVGINTDLLGEALSLSD